jgi:hypothetical protein
MQRLISSLGRTNSVHFVLLSCLVMCLLSGSILLAAPYHTPVIDGVITGDGVDWVSDDLVINDFDDDDDAAIGNVRTLRMTWDENNLYLGSIYQAIGFSTTIYLDTSVGIGPNSALDLDAFPRDVALPSGRSIDLIIAQNHPTAFATGSPLVYRILDAAGDTLRIDDLVTSAQTSGFDTDFPDKRFIFWFKTEIAIPWSVVYPDGMPDGAMIRAAQVVSPSEDNAAIEDAAPGIGRPAGATGFILPSMHTSVIDVDADSLPDPLDAVISGLVTLPLDPGTRSISVTATLTDGLSGEFDGPVSVYQGEDGVRTWSLGRLVPGSYDITASVPGYFPATTSINVAAGQTITDVELTLERATTISGILDTELTSTDVGESIVTSYVFRAPDGSALATIDQLLPSEIPHDFTFFVSDTGTYVLEARADFHLLTEFDIEVDGTSDVLDLAFTIPRAPLVEGIIEFASGDGADGSLLVVDAEADTIVYLEVPFTAADPSFSFYAPALGNLVLRASAPTYIADDQTIVVAAGEDMPGLTVHLDRLPEIRGSLLFADGPGGSGVMRALSVSDGDTTAVDVSVASFPSLFLPNGNYELEIDVDGYALFTGSFDLSDPNTVTDLGSVSLTAVRATELRLLDDENQPTNGYAATVSIPEDNFYSYAQLMIEAVDANGRRDLFDLDGKLADVELTARKLNDVSPPAGLALFLSEESLGSDIASISFTSGLSSFWMIDDVVEIIRVYVGPDVPDPLKTVTTPTGRFMIGFEDPMPRSVVITVSNDTLAAELDASITVGAQLYDSAGNPRNLPDIPISFIITGESTGRGNFTIPTVPTNGDGYAVAELTATGAGILLLSAGVTINNQSLDVLLETIDGEPGPAPITVIAGPAERVIVSTASTVVDFDEPFAVQAQLVDQFGNPSPAPGEALSFTADPNNVGAYDATELMTGQSGAATATFTPDGIAGVVLLDAISSLYPSEPVLVQLRDVQVENDPPWDSEPASANTFPPMDLTALVIDNTADELLLEIPFSSDWGGIQFHIIFETKWDEDGGQRNSFEMPVNYGHAHKPDYVLNLKYDLSYGDFRAWGIADPGWANWWDTDTNEWLTAHASGVEIQSRWINIDGSGFKVTMPWGPFGGQPDSLRCQVYVTQEDGDKRGAFDSVPSDATLDLDFDYLDPGPSDWDAAVANVTLTEWSQTYVVRTDFPTPPVVNEVTATPAEIAAGAPFVLSGTVTDAGDGIGVVLADLSNIAGPSLLKMHDDGEASHGDSQAGDGIYSVQAVVPRDAPGGLHDLTISAFDGSNVMAGREATQLDVSAEVEVIREEIDDIGDDHGPNLPGVADGGLFYTYPSNAVFVPGAFDLESLTVYETTSVVAGTAVPVIAFEVKVGDFPDPSDPETADWNPPYGDLNTQKIDILIDTGVGGATSGLPNRRLDVQPWNAWEYAIIMDGWFKAIVPSQGLNLLDAWRQNAMVDDASISIVGDFEADTITALIAKSALGDPNIDDVKSWNIAVMLSSHDFGGEEVLGGIRWISQSRSEWNFGGGHQTDRDANIMDLILSPGAGLPAGRDQSYILDYTQPEAEARLDQALTPCQLEISEFVDTGPPVVSIDRNENLLVRRFPLDDSPVAFSVKITDDFAVASASLRYRPTTTQEWSVIEDMGFVGNDLWSTDIPWDWFNENLGFSPVDSTRYLEFQIVAVDASDEEKTTITPVTTLQIDPARSVVYAEAPMNGGDVTIRQVEGSEVVFSDELRLALIEDFATETSATITTDSLATLMTMSWKQRQVGALITGARSATTAQFLGPARMVEFEISDGETVMPLEGRLPQPFSLSLHYDHLDVPDRHSHKVALFEFVEASNRWVLVGGHVNTNGAEVEANIDHAGVYGVFLADDLGVDRNEVMSGLQISPNPFSPNNDGLYDRTNISFFLTRDATVTVEIYNIDGQLRRRMQESFPYTGDEFTSSPERVSGLIWDGTDSQGRFVPYGIYVMKIMVAYLEGGDERIQASTHSLAVIR